ncbi:MAG: potassium channel family protein [Actinomycetota bacterium]
MRHSAPFRRFALLVAAIVGVFAYAVTGYMLLGFGFVDALYMSALALTTAGFNPVRELDGAEQIFTVTVAISGVSIFLAILAILGRTLVEGRLVSRRRRMERRVDRIDKHFVVCAYGRVGRTVAREFEAEGVRFVVVEPLEEMENQMINDGVLFILGDPTSETVLTRAGIERARGLVCAMDSDAKNVYITLAARSLNPDIFIVARASEAVSADRLYRAGANRVISPYVSSGRHMALLALRPRVVDYFDLGLGEKPAVRLEELLIEPDSQLIGRSLDEVCVETIPLAIRRDAQLVPNPDPQLRLAAGDLLILMGEQEALRPVEGD